MTAAPEAGARPAPCHSDWRRAAELLARRESLTTVARAIGCSRKQLSERRNHDPLFQGWIEQFKAKEMPAAERLSALRHAVRAEIEKEVGKGTLSVVLWLADRLSLVTPPSERTPGDELQQILSGLSAAELEEFESLRDAP